MEQTHTHTATAAQKHSQQQQQQQERQETAEAEWHKQERHLTDVPLLPAYPCRTSQLLTQSRRTSRTCWEVRRTAHATAAELNCSLLGWSAEQHHQVMPLCSAASLLLCPLSHVYVFQTRQYRTVYQVPAVWHLRGQQNSICAVLLYCIMHVGSFPQQPSPCTAVLLYCCLCAGALFKALFKWFTESGPVYLLPTGPVSSFLVISDPAGVLVCVCGGVLLHHRAWFCIVLVGTRPDLACGATTCKVRYPYPPPVEGIRVPGLAQCTCCLLDQSAAS
jgi:hypothetical protein